MISSPDMSSGWEEADVTEGSRDGIRQSGRRVLDHVGPRQWLRLAGSTAAHNRSRAPVQRGSDERTCQGDWAGQEKFPPRRRKRDARFGGNKTAGFWVSGGNTARSARRFGGTT